MPIVMNFNNAGSTADGKIDGVGTIMGGVYGRLRINGVCTVEGDLEAESLEIDGVCTCTGSVEAKSFDCDGVLTIEGNMRVGTADIDGVVTVKGSKIEADEIKCDGVVNVEGEISADVINANGKINAEAIVGDRIKIKSYWKTRLGRLLLLIGEKVNTKQSVVNLIEGTTVELRGVRAKFVNGHDVSIGRNCEIGRVDASGKLYIDPMSRVDEVVAAS
ncbi:MAG: hypothetical protein FWG03_01300 [Clostridiales bacterium]|nr:hypothetical protein [Clostridiales bacterium]